MKKQSLDVLVKNYKGTLHTFEVDWSGNADKFMTGLNSHIKMDGKKLKFVKNFTYTVDARGIGEVTLVFYGNMKMVNKPVAITKVKKK